jgi:hypothetical protein
LLIVLELLGPLDLVGDVVVDVLVISLELCRGMSLAGGVGTTWAGLPLIGLWLCCRLSLAGGMMIDSRGKSMPPSARTR